MKKIITSIFIVVFVLFSWLNVKASEWYEIELGIEKAENSGELYNEMPTSVNKGDIITVKVMVKNAMGNTLGYGDRNISWDKEAFEIVETNGQYYSSPDSKINYMSARLIRDNSMVIEWWWDEEEATADDIAVLELKFKVKNNVKSGIYEITQNPSTESLEVIGSDQSRNLLDAYTRVLQYQVGKMTVTSNYTKADIENIAGDVYVIGNHLFTRAGSDEYDGTLTTEHIMLASKSIESNSTDDMIIYTKDLFGDWKNAINDEDITTPPNEFKISYVDMKAKYAHNGIYSSNDFRNNFTFIF